MKLFLFYPARCVSNVMVRTFTNHYTEYKLNLIKEYSMNADDILSQIKKLNKMGNKIPYLKDNLPESIIKELDEEINNTSELGLYSEAIEEEYRRVEQYHLMRETQRSNEKILEFLSELILTSPQKYKHYLISTQAFFASANLFTEKQACMILYRCKSQKKEIPDCFNFVKIIPLTD